MNRFNLEGGKIFLRKLRITDAVDIYTNVKDKEISRWTSHIPYPYPKDAALKFIRRSHYQAAKKTKYIWGIISKETNKLLGVIGLIGIDWKNKHAEVGYWLGKNHWRKGIMTEAVSLVLTFAFKNLKLHGVHAMVFEANIGSSKTLEKNGFIIEGKERETYYRYKGWHSILRLGVLRKEWHN